jgi:hypothetical protein
MAIDQNAVDQSIVLRATEWALTRFRSLFLYERLMAALPEPQRASAGEIYVLAHLAGSVIFFAAAPFGTPAWIFYVFTAVGIYRLLDIYSYHLRRVFVLAWQTGYAGVQSLRRSIFLTLVNFAELIIIFAIIFRTIERSVSAAAFAPIVGGKSEALSLAVSTATAAGFEPRSPIALAARTALIMEVILAVALLLIVVGLIVGAALRVGGRRGE